MVPIRETTPLRGMAVVSVSFGFWSLVVFWWFPYSMVISSAGSAMGLFTLAIGVRGRNGENFPLLGAALCTISLTVILTITQVLHLMIWK